MSEAKDSSYQLDAYIGATQRYRWAVLATILIAGLMLCQLYVEQYSNQPYVLQREIARAILHNDGNFLKQKEAGFAKAFPPGVPDSSPDREGNHVMESIQEKDALAYADRKYHYLRMDNTLRDSKMGAVALPFLGLSVPANDFIPILAAMLAIFCGAVWLNSRAIWAALEEGIKEALDPQRFLSIARLHLTFTGATALESQRPFARLVQYGALWMPLVAFSVGIAIDLYPLFSQPQVQSANHSGAREPRRRQRVPG